MHRHRLAPRRQRGFTLAEMMVAIALGLIIVAGMTTLFVDNSKAQGEIEKANRQVENGRYAVSQLTTDLRNAGFYGEFDPTVLATPAALPDPCALAVADLKTALPLHIQGVDNAAAGALSCLTDLRPGTDIVVVRHTRTCVAGDSNCEPVSAGGPYFQASLCSNPSELDSANPNDQFALDTVTTTLALHKRDCTQVAGSGTPAVIRKYQTNIYFVANNDNPGDGIPTLKRAELGGTSTLAFTIVPLVEGIENLQLEYGVDSDANGSPDSYTAAPASAADWRNVVAVKLNVLARNLETSSGFTDKKMYVMGNKADGTPNQIAAANDHYKRHLFQSVVNLPNPAGRKMP